MSKSAPHSYYSVNYNLMSDISQTEGTASRGPTPPPVWTLPRRTAQSVSPLRTTEGSKDRRDRSLTPSRFGFKLGQSRNDQHRKKSQRDNANNDYNEIIKQMSDANITKDGEIVKIKMQLKSSRYEVKQRTLQTRELEKRVQQLENYMSELKNQMEQQDKIIIELKKELAQRPPRIPPRKSSEHVRQK